MDKAKNLYKVLVDSAARMDPILVIAASPLDAIEKVLKVADITPIKGYDIVTVELMYSNLID
jgi:predicted subunit of tRNA(5-methylaminomethyl-2-thiouridylate) methyltransferase